MGRIRQVGLLPPELQERAIVYLERRWHGPATCPVPSTTATLWCGHPRADVRSDNGIEWCPHCSGET